MYFRVRSDPGYGTLSHRQLENMDQGEDAASDPLTERKQDPLDFALWKVHKPGEDTRWPAPWGEGRPGWHIECSAMAEEFLGVGFDIHGGGSDLVFPHHENEAAQTRAARGAELTKLWMHNGMIQFTGEKMAKSVGNIALLHEVLGRIRPGGRRHVPDLGPLPPAAGVLRGRARAGAGERQAHPRGRSPAALADGDSTPRTGPVVARQRSSTRSPSDFNTPRRSPRSTSGSARRRPPRRGSAGDAHCARCSGVLGLETLLEAATEAPAARRASWPLNASGRAASATSRRPTGCAMRSRALGWEVRDGPGGFELIPL